MFNFLLKLSVMDYVQLRPV